MWFPVCSSAAGDCSRRPLLRPSIAARLQNGRASRASNAPPSKQPAFGVTIERPMTRGSTAGAVESCRVLRALKVRESPRQTSNVLEIESGLPSKRLGIFVTLRRVNSPRPLHLPTKRTPAARNTPGGDPKSWVVAYLIGTYLRRYSRQSRSEHTQKPHSPRA